MSSSTSKRSLALLFSGQGSQAKGFPLLSTLTEKQNSNSWKLLQQVDEMSRLTFDFSLLSVMRDNPHIGHINGKKYSHPNGLLSNTIFAQPAILTYQQACFEHFLEQIGLSRREFLKEISASSHVHDEKTARSTALGFDSILLAGHSLGEFSALASLCPHVFSSVADAAELVTRRGLAMAKALESLGLPGGTDAAASGDLSPSSISHFVMVAVNPKKAMLSEEQLLLLIELVSEAVILKLRRPHTLLELANDNLHDEQLVIAADRYCASVLGKCVDPQWRSSCLENGIDTFGDLVQAAVYDADLDERAGVTRDPNAPPPKDFVPGSIILGKQAAIGLPRWVSADGGVTLPEERLTRVSNVGSGRSGLKKRVFYVQLPVEVPFHSSALRHAFDDLYGHVNKKVVAASKSPIFGSTYPKVQWIPNITGTKFDSSSSSSFRAELLETLSENVNVGEQTHVGKMTPRGLTDIIQRINAMDSSSSSSSATTPGTKNSAENERTLLVSALTAQLCNVVCWSQTMDTLFEELNEDSVVVEFAPSTSVLNELMKRANPEKISKEQYYLLPRDIDKCLQFFKK